MTPCKLISYVRRGALDPPRCVSPARIKSLYWKTLLLIRAKPKHQLSHKEAPITAQLGKAHYYLGMTLDISKRGTVRIRMIGYSDNMLDPFACS